MWLRQYFSTPKKIAVGASIVLLIGGILEAIFCHDHVQRSGAMVIVYSIVLLSLNRFVTPTEDKLDRYAKFSSEISQLTDDGQKDKMRRHFDSDRSSHDEFVKYHSDRELLDRERKQLMKSRDSIVNTEAGMLIIGTLVWGYGDLLLNIQRC